MGFHPQHPKHLAWLAAGEIEKWRLHRDAGRQWLKRQPVGKLGLKGRGCRVYRGESIGALGNRPNGIHSPSHDDDVE